MNIELLSNHRLGTDRGPAIESVQHRIAERILSQTRRRNVGRQERQTSLWTGGGLWALGLLGPRSARPLALLSGAALLYRGITGHCHLYGMLGIDSSQADAKGVPARHGFRHEQTISIQRSPEDLYSFWRDVSNLPRVMHHLKSVIPDGESRSTWVACAPFDVELQWKAEIFQDRKNEMIAWRSLPGGDVDTAGSVHFEALPGNRGTALKLSIKYNPPGGKLTAALAWLVGEGAEARIDEDLRRFKSFMEAGEAPTTEGQPRGPRE
jgi:uncharacterized membrane protein